MANGIHTNVTGLKRHLELAKYTLIMFNMRMELYHDEATANEFKPVEGDFNSLIGIVPKMIEKLERMISV